MNFADQYKNSNMEEPLMEIEFDMDGPGFRDKKLVTISEDRFMEVAEEASFKLIEGLEQTAEKEGIRDSHAVVATLMTNIILIEDIRRALFGDKDVPEKK